MTNEISEILRKKRPLSNLDQATVMARIIALRMRKIRLDKTKPLADLEENLFDAEIEILEGVMNEEKKIERLRTSGLKFIRGGKL